MISPGTRAWILGAACLVATGATAATLTDNFNVNRNYLTNGVAGTIWDGVYFGAGEFNNSGVGGGGPGATVQCDANLTAANRLTLQTTGTAWEGADDDGFFLYKVMKGDFSAVVKIVTPYNNANFNTAGLQARAFSAGGDPFGGSEDYVSWTRFDQFGFANYLRNEVNGSVQQINPGGAPNSAYWLRLDRIGNTFRFYQRTNSGDAWRVVSFPAPVSGTNLTRSDLAGQSLQVGIIHATFNNQLGVQFSDFSITATNFDSFAAPPSPATGLTVSPNGSGAMNVSWTPGVGSAGSVVVVWAGTNVVKQVPANAFTYTGNATYGLGSTLPAGGHYVVHAGAGTSVIVNGLALNTTYNVAVYAYAGTGNSISYHRNPPVASLTIPPNQVVAALSLQAPNVQIAFSANPGKWYWLEFTDALNPSNWQLASSEPVYANSGGEVMIHVNGALSGARFYRLREVSPDFGIKSSNATITSLKRTGDAFDTEFIAGGRRLGDANLKYRQTGTNWVTARTVNLTGISSVSYSTNADGTQYKGRYLMTNGLSGALVFESAFSFRQDTIGWTLSFTNLTGQPIELGDLALPLPMNTTFSSPTTCALKHHLVAGHGSFVFWMRPNSVGPYLVFTPGGQSKLEYWDVLNGGFEVYIHSLAAGTATAAAGTKWRQTNTSLTLSAGGTQTYEFKFQWADDYEGVRQALVNEGNVDAQIIPGMTVPTNLFAHIALRTTQTVHSIQAEFPAQTQIQSLGANAGHLLYQVQFAKLGENRLIVHYGNGRHKVLEFFVTEPVETLIKKRAAFSVNTQVVDPGKWYDGLYAEWNMSSQVLVTPDNYDLIVGFVRYEVASDDAGLSRPAYMAVKLAEFPVQSEVTSLDHYIENFVWGGLQRTTNETYAYGIYGVQDWYSNRNSANTGTGGQLHLWRIYDYPHIIAMYHGMYRVAKNHPQVTTLLPASEYLRRAYGTANALYTVPLTLTGWSAYNTGLMNELVMEDLIADLEAEGWTAEAATLRTHWERKVFHFVTGNPNLFGSEYAFDSTGFETQHALAKYALANANTMAATNPATFTQQAQAFLEEQTAANIFCRGWLETAYYYYGSDYRQQMGNEYLLSYMAQMGGWSLLDYALYYSTNASEDLRLGYASILSAWALMNTGTPESNYGYWYPGAGNDGACGGGFEAGPSGTTWLGQPHRRGSWYYSCEQGLGFCGGVRAAATILADDPIFGRICYGGTWQQSTNLQVFPKDGVRKRFHAVLDAGKLHLTIETDRFVATQPILLNQDFSQVTFTLETENPAAHTARLRFSAPTGTYTISDSGGTIAMLNVQAGQQYSVNLPVGAGTSTKTFYIVK